MQDIRVQVADPHSTIALQLIAELSAELGPQYGDDGSAAFTPDDTTIPRAALVIVYADGEAVGCGAIRPLKDSGDGDTAEIKRMYIRRSMRGRGLSKRLMIALHDLAAEFGYMAIQLETGIYQTEAIGLYERVGYQRIPCWGQYVDSPHSLCYRLELKRPE